MFSTNLSASIPYFIVFPSRVTVSPLLASVTSKITVFPSLISCSTVSPYLDMAELQAERHIPMTMEDWEKRLNGFLQLWDKEILNDSGKSLCSTC
ncbi:RhuM family protein [Dialister micraerophilus]|uniref:RhuM family protein n=1 Tax=Dialister micraerophilus TaxID=309120 RepID=UPI003D666B45